MYKQDDEVIALICSQRDQFVCYLGAGASIEADIPAAEKICRDIRDETQKLYPGRRGAKRKSIKKWLDERLKWSDDELRYPTCIQTYRPNQDWRVKFFRSIVRGKNPSFCHHAVAALMR